MSGAGRPADPDELNIYLFVTVGDKRTGLNVRQFCRRRDTAYWGRVALVADKRGRRSLKHRPHPLRGEALRRRYGKAQRALGLTPPPLHEQNIAFDPRVMEMAKETVDQLVAEALATN